jgi:hypothetical protein
VCACAAGSGRTETCLHTLFFYIVQAGMVAPITAIQVAANGLLGMIKEPFSIEFFRF